MKKLLVTLILSILFVSSTVAGKKTDREIDGLIGLVKEVRTEKAHFSSKFGKWVEGHRTRWTIETYDTKGNKIEKGYWGGSAKTVYTYDTKGNMIEEAKFNADGSLTIKRVYTYDAKGNMIETYGFIYLGGIEIHVSKKVYTYDAKGNMIEEAKFNADSSLDYKTVYTYDAKGNMIEEALYKADGSLFSKDVFTYDTKGNKIETTEYKADGSLPSKYAYTYTYDAKGNWIKKTESKWVTKFGKSYFEPSEVVYRTITYYKKLKQ